MGRQNNLTMKKDRFYAALIRKPEYNISSVIEIEENYLHFFKETPANLRKKKMAFHFVNEIDHYPQLPRKVGKFILQIDRDSKDAYVCTYGIDPRELPKEKIIEKLKWIEAMDDFFDMGVFPETGFLKRING